MSTLGDMVQYALAVNPHDRQKFMLSKLGRVTRTIKGKLGVYFDKDDYVIAFDMRGRGFVHRKKNVVADAWSAKHEVWVFLNRDEIEWVEED